MEIMEGSIVIPGGKGRNERISVSTICSSWSVGTKRGDDQIFMMLPFCDFHLMVI